MIQIDILTEVDVSIVYRGIQSKPSRQNNANQSHCKVEKESSIQSSERTSSKRDVAISQRIQQYLVKSFVSKDKNSYKVESTPLDGELTGSNSTVDKLSANKRTADL